MSDARLDAAVTRALEESKADTEYATPYELVSANLRLQPSKPRPEVVQLLVNEFALHEFDAETIARSAADLAQLRDAARTVRKRRYGQLEVSFIEFDVVTWRILPSIENVRFEGDRAWNPDNAARYSSLGAGQPVLSLTVDDPGALLAGLRAETTKIWRSNPHSRSIPMRGIETSGLLSIARVKLGNSPVVGILDATDGFSRTVGAHRGSGVDVAMVLGDLQSEGLENKFRAELIAVRDDGTASLDSDEGEIAATRLRSSVMPRAQVIVGYRWLDGITESKRDDGFDGARRQLVGHIHLEPPLKFTDSTQFALKARIALRALSELDLLPVLENYSAAEIRELLLSGTVPESEVSRGVEGPLKPDEILLLAVDAIRGQSGQTSEIKAVIRAIYALTGKKPSRGDRTMIAVDSAMRANRLALGIVEPESDFSGRRSTIARALAHSSFNTSKLTRTPIMELLSQAISRIRGDELKYGVSRDVKVSPFAAELGALAVHALVEAEGEPLLVRSGAKLLVRSGAKQEASYLPEAPEIMNKMMTSEAGLNQLAQVVLDARAKRRLTAVPSDGVALDAVNADRDRLSQGHLVAFVRGGSWTAEDGASLDEGPTLDQLILNIRSRATQLKDLVDAATAIPGVDGGSLVESGGADMQADYDVLEDVAFVLRKWTETESRRSQEVDAAQEADSDYLDDFDSSDDTTDEA